MIIDVLSVSGDKLFIKRNDKYCNGSIIEKNKIQSSIIRLQKNINQCEKLLKNKSFTNNASTSKIKKEYKKKLDFETQINSLKEGNELIECSHEFNYLLSNLKSTERIGFHIQYMREIECKLPMYSNEWIEFVYEKHITSSEYISLYEISNNLQ